MKVAFDSMETIEAMARIGSPNSVSDAAVGAICARSSVLAAYLNVQINAATLDDTNAADAYLAEGHAIEQKAISKEHEILEIARSRISS
jgi:glutamate formiminotransferase/formiminotetrahydrofolate cyclodeaminase